MIKLLVSNEPQTTIQTIFYDKNQGSCKGFAWAKTNNIK